jgi:hypothetical protein
MAYLTKTDRIMEQAAAPGTGNVTLGGAVTGFRTFASVLNSANPDTCAYLIEAVDANGIPTGPWERGFGTLTAATTFVRTVVLESMQGPGSAVNFTTGIRISSVPMTETTQFYPQPGGRLTLSATLPVAEVGGGSTMLYYLPYLHDRVPLWNGYAIQVVSVTNGVSLNLTSVGLAINSVYDVFGFISATGAMNLEVLVWTDLHNRATNITVQNGLPCKQTDATRLYLGTFYTPSGNQIYDVGTGVGSGGQPKRYLWNYYNRVQRHIVMYDNTASWSWATNAWRVMRGLTPPNGTVEMVRGNNDDEVILYATLACNPPVNCTGYVCFSLDSATATTGPCSYGMITNNATYNLAKQITAVYTGYPGIGYHYMGCMENSYGGTVSFGGNWGGNGIAGIVWA